MKILGIRDPNFKQKRALWIYICLFCLIPFLINSKEAKEPEIAPKLDTGSKVQVPSVSSPPSRIKPKKRLGYRNYTYSSSFGGSGLGDGFFDRPVAISVDSQNNIYVVDQGNNLIQKFDQNGEFLYEWGKWEKKKIKPRDFDTPTAIAVDKNNNVYVVDTNNNRVLKFYFGEEKPSVIEVDSLAIDNRGSALEYEEVEEKGVKVIALGFLGSGEGNFQKPIDIVIDKNESIYVLDSGNYRIQKFNHTGDFEEEWGSYGSCRECFLDPISFAYDPTGFGYLYVLDKQRQGFILHKIDMDGRFVKTLDVFHNTECLITQPIDIYIDDDGFLYIIDQATSAACKFNTDGEFIQKIGGESPSRDKDATLKKPHAIVMDSDKRLLIVNVDDSLIKIFDQI